MNDFLYLYTTRIGYIFFNNRSPSNFAIGVLSYGETVKNDLTYTLELLLVQANGDATIVNSLLGNLENFEFNKKYEK